NWLSGILALLFMAGVSAAPRGEVVVVLSQDTDAYREVVRAMRAELTRQNRADLPVRVLTLNEFQSQYGQIVGQRPVLLVSVGTQAARELADRRPPVPVLHTLLPRQTWQSLARAPGQASSAIFLDQPIDRQLLLLKHALPGRTNLGVILGPASAGQRHELMAAARRQGFQLQIEAIDQPAALLPALNRVVEDSQVLVSVADPMVFGPSTVHHILLTTYRYRVPVLGLSRAYVEAGALLAVYSTPEHIGRQLGELVSRMAAGRWVLPAPQYPKYYDVATNPRVAASLNLRLERESVLLMKLEAAEGQR
ncbi:MAG: ABC transporter substrate binding protein, partial [Pseudomonadota bacterium]